MTNSRKLLAVDDEEFNLDIMTHHLTKVGYDVICAEDGVIALKKLEENPEVSVIVLDRMMPNMDGMEFLQRIRADNRFLDIPVVMQTAAAQTAQILQGLKAGVRYYLTKPYEQALLVAVVNSAWQDAKNRMELKGDVRKNRRILGLMDHSSFHFRTLEEARNLAYYIANCFPEPEAAVFGLNELLVNAVEHGNLGITYAEKTELILRGDWEKEVERRLSMPEYREKSANLNFTVTTDAIAIRIKDEGKGFDWHKYLDLSPDRATDPNGRGVATSRRVSFDSMEYLGTGNEVLCTVKLRREKLPS